MRSWRKFFSKILSISRSSIFYTNKRLQTPRALWKINVLIHEHIYLYTWNMKIFLKNAKKEKLNNFLKNEYRKSNSRTSSKTKTKIKLTQHIFPITHKSLSHIRTHSQIHFQSNAWEFFVFFCFCSS